jgi:hypothetical protein
MEKMIYRNPGGRSMTKTRKRKKPMTNAERQARYRERHCKPPPEKKPEKRHYWTDDEELPFFFDDDFIPADLDAALA